MNKEKEFKKQLASKLEEINTKENKVLTILEEPKIEPLKQELKKYEERVKELSLQAVNSFDIIDDFRFVNDKLKESIEHSSEILSHVKDGSAFVDEGQSIYRDFIDVSRVQQDSLRILMQSYLNLTKTLNELKLKENKKEVQNITTNNNLTINEKINPADIIKKLK